MTRKANILKVGKIVLDVPDGWVFDDGDREKCAAAARGIYCGYTLDELKAIADGSAFDKPSNNEWLDTEMYPIPMNRKVIYCDCEGRMFLDYGDKIAHSTVTHWRELPEMP